MTVRETKVAKNRELFIAGRKILPGEKVNVHLPFSETYLGSPISVPVRVICGEKDGPRVFLTGAIHGDELTGIGIIRELIYDHFPELTCGTLICMPVVNVYGLEHHSRYLPDRRDLNRCFPGSQNGSLSSRLAHSVYNEVISQCDYGIDFHSAAVRRTNYPNIRADMRNKGANKLAKMFGSELIVDGKGPAGSLRHTAVKNGVPVVILEAGEVWKNEPSVVETGVRGVLNVLKSLGMMEGEPKKPLFQVIARKTKWVRAECGGFLGFHAKPGDVVEKGQPLATNYSIFGSEKRSLISPEYGIVLGMSTMPAVKPGEPVYHIAVINEPTFKKIRKRIDQSSDKLLFNRLQSDLSTNITIEEHTSSDEIPLP